MPKVKTSVFYLFYSIFIHFPVAQYSRVIQFFVIFTFISL
ncbi:hypothetical protein EVA_16694 [gut metagenome]|uniref:Uncharacterized protein n=1 Tax=gut metagenome TaxID=749906 RepID=J9FLA0_9ZZZZ